MIELRWFERRQIVPETAWEPETGFYVQTLQFRTRKASASEFGNIADWTNWQDVPTVREGK